jgi:hypothetical protein
MARSDGKFVYILSDSFGETAERVVLACLAQFPHTGNLELKRITNVSEKETVERILKEAKQAGTFVAYTIVLEELRTYVREMAQRLDVIALDIMGPALKAIEAYTGERPSYQPGLMHRLDEDYFKKIEAVEFAVKYDDGKDPRGFLRADIVLLGVSRTSKTPLAMYLANKRYCVANLPIVPELRPPKELNLISKDKIVGLTISPEKLIEVRKERLKTLGLIGQANYALPTRIEQEVAYAHQLYQELGCYTIDVTHRAIEETATRIIDWIEGQKRL